MPGKKSRDKGFNAEREIVNIAKAAGRSAKRSTCSFGVDIIIDNQDVSAKRRANGMKWAYDELDNHDYVLFRADHKQWLKIEIWKP